MENSKTGHAPLDAVQEAMGSLGPWHIILSILISLVNFPVAWNQLSIVFIAPPTTFTCVSPKSMDNETVSALPCRINVGNNTIEKCTEFEYDRSVFPESIITQWNLVCEREHLAHLAQSISMFGFLVGSMLFSAIADRIGRKIPLVAGVALLSISGIIAAFVPWYELFLILKFISTVATGGIIVVSFVLFMELIGIEWRSIFSVLFHIPFLIGYLSNPLISYLTRTWYGFQLAVSVPPILLLSYYWLLPESPRWLLAVGRLDEAEAVLKQAAKKNKIPLGNVKAAIESRNGESRNNDAQNNHNITDLFKTPNLRIKTICVCVNWFVNGVTFFGAAQYIGYLDGNIFVNVAISATLQFPGIIIVLFLISRFSRLKTLVIGNLVAAFSLLLVTVVPSGTISVALAMIGLGGMSISFPIVFLYSSEVFPTVIRNTGIGLGSVSARVGSMIAPYIVAMNTLQPWLPPFVFGIGPLIGAILCMFLPETMDCELPETIQDGENFGKKEKSIAETSTRA